MWFMHLEFARGEFRERRRRWGVRRGAVEEALDQAPRDFGRQERLPVGNQANCVYESFGRVRLHEESGRSGSERLVHVLVEAVGREHEHPRADPLVDESARRVDAVEDGHADVHEHHVGVERSAERNGFQAVRGLSDDLDVVVCLEDHAHACTDHGLIVCEENADHCVRGSAARTVQPPSGRGPASNRPPNTATRSPIPASPRRLPGPLARSVPSSADLNLELRWS